MPVSINGQTGVITGLTAGGLPDGCILDADINGVAASKLTGTLPDARFPATLPAISGANLTNISAGKILQVKQTTKLDTFSTSSQSYTDVTGLSVSITPASSSNKILIILDIKVGAGHEDAAFAGRLVRGSTAIYVGNASGASGRTLGSFGTSRQSGNAGYDIIQDRQAVFLDSPSTTSATTYKVQVQGNNGRDTLVNRTSDDSDDDDTPRVASSITVMEVAA